jgi:hypothetical protein
MSGSAQTGEMRSQPEGAPQPERIRLVPVLKNQHLRRDVEKVPQLGKLR